MATETADTQAPVTGDAKERRARLVEYFYEVSECNLCPLAEGRTNVVFGTGAPNADLMFVGEAPGFHEDRQGKPFVGPAGQLLDRLLGEIGMARPDVFIANVLKCRPPGNRDPRPAEIEACQGHLHRQVELVEPRVVCTLGNFATKLLTGQPTGISRVHGRTQEHQLGSRSVLIYPIFHPAAALRSTTTLETLREDIVRLPEVLAGAGQGHALPSAQELIGEADRRQDEKDADPDSVGGDQLGLF